MHWAFNSQRAVCLHSSLSQTQTLTVGATAIVCLQHLNTPNIIKALD